VLRFAAPAGVVTAISAYVTYNYVLGLSQDDVSEARSAAVVTLFVTAWWVLVMVARPWSPLRWAICGAMLVGFLGVLFIPPLSSLFALEWHADKEGVVALAVGVLGAAVITGIRLWSEKGRHAAPGRRDGVVAAGVAG
jgi:cation-transporting ATPase E